MQLKEIVHELNSRIEHLWRLLLPKPGIFKCDSQTFIPTLPTVKYCHRKAA